MLELLVVLVLARFMGEIAERTGQPASVGEIFAGMMLATTAMLIGEDLPLVQVIASSDAVFYAADIGIFSLVLLAAVEMEPRELADGSAGAFAVALGGVLVPFASGFALALAFLPDSELRLAQALLTGTVLAITAVPATAKVLEEFGALHTRIGTTVLSAALFDDLLGLLLLAVLLGMIETGHLPDLATLGALLAKVALFFAITVALGTRVYPHVSRGLKTMQAAAFEFSALAMVSLAYGWLAELLNMHWILGAFTAGLFFERSRVGLRAYNEIKLILTAVTSGVLGPLFFASIGLRIDFSALTGAPLFLLLLIVIAFAGKIVGAGLPARWSGLSRHEALTVGVGMGARGAVGFVVLSIAFGAGLFNTPGDPESLENHLFSVLVLMTVVTTMLTPIFLRRLLPRGNATRKPNLPGKHLRQ